MRLSTKSRFAVNAMIEVALRGQQGPVSLLIVGERLEISRTYLEQLISRLRQHGLLESTRGRTGGYMLARSAAKISVADIIAAVEDVGVEAEAGDAAARAPQAAQTLWRNLNLKMLEYLQSVTLAQLMAEQAALQPAAQLVPRRRAGVFEQARPAPVKSRAPNSVFNLAKVLAG